MFRNKFVQNIKTHVLCSIISFLKRYHLRDNARKYITGTEGILTIWRIIILCCKFKAKDKHSDYVIIIASLQ